MISKLYNYHKNKNNYIIDYEEFRDFVKEKLDSTHHHKICDLFESLGHNDITEMKKKNKEYLSECKRKNNECEKTHNFNILCEKESDADEKHI